MRQPQPLTRWYRVLRKYRTPFAVANLARRPRMAADSRGAVYPELGVFYNRIPKAANTTVVSLLHEIESGTIDQVDAIKGGILRPSRLSWKQASQFHQLFKFTFVRNPYDRLLSAWLQKVAPGSIETYATIPGFGEDSRSGFASFVAYLAAGGLLDNKHWTPQYRLMVLPPSQFDFIGRVESFNGDMQTVLQRTGLSLPEGRSLDELYPTDKAGKRTRAGERLRTYYTPESAEIVRRLYKTDFRRFGYSIDSEWVCS